MLRDDRIGKATGNFQRSKKEKEKNRKERRRFGRSIRK